MTTVSPHTPDPESTPPLHDELLAMAKEFAPRLFAVAQTWTLDDGTTDGWIAAWGLAYEDGQADLFGTGGGTIMRLNSPQSAVTHFGRGENRAASLVWPDAA
ncbi:hypothetical protein [Streptomyces sp. NPDC048442]|uniref:hypothetical protein n=1 Tax=Streptomyces sp. NPDC048442 TaxID=3154823 RepID=UPI003434E8A3